VAKSKRNKLFAEKVDRIKLYPVDEALALLKDLANAKFSESVDVAVNLGVDPRKSDQVVTSMSSSRRPTPCEWSVRWVGCWARAV
jgi:ribosomal protein L1